MHECVIGWGQVSRYGGRGVECMCDGWKGGWELMRYVSWREGKGGGGVYGEGKSEEMWGWVLIRRRNYTAMRKGQ